IDRTVSNQRIVGQGIQVERRSLAAEALAGETTQLTSRLAGVGTDGRSPAARADEASEVHAIARHPDLADLEEVDAGRTVDREAVLIDGEVIAGTVPDAMVERQRDLATIPQDQEPTVDRAQSLAGVLPIGRHVGPG